MYPPLRFFIRVHPCPSVSKWVLSVYYLTLAAPAWNIEGFSYEFILLYAFFILVHPCPSVSKGIFNLNDVQELKQDDSRSNCCSRGTCSNGGVSGFSPDAYRGRAGGVYVDPYGSGVQCQPGPWSGQGDERYRSFFRGDLYGSNRRPADCPDNACPFCAGRPQASLPRQGAEGHVAAHRQF